MSDSSAHEFRSRTDIGGIILIWGFPIGVFIGIDLFYELTSKFLTNPRDMWVFAIVYYPIWICSFVFLYWMIRSIKYIVDDELLTVKAIGQNRSIHIRNIERIKISYNPISAPATSLRRLLVLGKNNKWLCLISPDREKEFIELLLQIKPSIQMPVSLR